MLQVKHICVMIFITRSIHYLFIVYHVKDEHCAWEFCEGLGVFLFARYQINSFSVIYFKVLYVIF